MIDYFKTGTGGSVDVTDLRNNFIPFPDHNAILPFLANARDTNQGTDAMLNRPFFRNNNNDWRIHEGNDWEMDDNTPSMD